MKYFEEDLILNNHHGGRAHHSTMTAKMIVVHHCHKAKDSNKLGVILSSDLSSAYDSIENSTLLKS